jgi:hypothetical protein
VDTIGGFAATNHAGPEGLSLEEVREALGVFAKQKNLAAFDVAAYNPAKDADGSGARTIIDLLEGVLRARLEFLKSVEPSAKATPPAAEAASSVAAGQAWSSDSLEEPSESPEATGDPTHPASETQE